MSKDVTVGLPKDIQRDLVLFVKGVINMDTEYEPDSRRVKDRAVTLLSRILSSAPTPAETETGAKEKAPYPLDWGWGSSGYAKRPSGPGCTCNTGADKPCPIHFPQDQDKTMPNKAKPKIKKFCFHN